MTTTTDARVRAAGPASGQGRWLMLIVLLAGQFMALLDAMCRS
jgi:hypothetical protein